MSVLISCQVRQSDQSWQALTFRDPYPYLRSWRDCYFLHLVLCCKATSLRKHTDLHYYHMVSGYFFLLCIHRCCPDVCSSLLHEETIWGGKTLLYFASSRAARAGIWRSKLKLRLWKKVTYWHAFRLTFNCFYSSHSHLPRGGTNISGLGRQSTKCHTNLPIGQSDRGIATTDES